MSAEPEPKPTRSPRRALGLVFLLVALFLVVSLEVGSRICDRIVASRRSDPARFQEMTRRTHAPDLPEKLYWGALEYGDFLRAEQQGAPRSYPHPYLGFALLPDFSSPSGAEQQVHHNSMGFRGKETTWEKPAGVYRIVTTGGSSVYGQSESCDAAVWSQRLEDYLNFQGGGRKFEVVNVGCPGWTSFEMLINLELRALDLQPDLVIVYEAINDMRAALYNGGGETQRDNTHWRAPWVTERPSGLETLLQSSRTYLIWRRYATSYVEKRSDLGFFGVKNLAQNFDVDTYAHTAEGRPLPERGFLNYRRNLDNIITLVKAHGAQVLLVTQALPRWHLDPKKSLQDQCEGFGRIQNIQRELANQRAVPLFECAEIVEKACEKQLYEERDRQQAAHPGMTPGEAENEARKIVGKKTKGGLFWSEVHPNDAGSDLIAKLISEYLLGTLLAQPK